MAKGNSDYDQYDPKVFKETLGSFGTTTKPGGNQLAELQTKVRQGVKHVELHLASTGKGQFNVQDVPDKYGFEQRRTIMQLAKLNKQSLSVHGTFDVVSFSGLQQGGFNEAQRATSIKELDETLKFAAETAKGGAVVFHIQGDPIPTGRGELNISTEYLDWLKNKAKEDDRYKKEYENLKNEYFTNNPLNRRFVDNVDQEKEIRIEFDKMKNSNISSDKELVEKAMAKAEKSGKAAWEEYYVDKILEKNKVAPDFDPLIVIGDKIQGASRQQEMIDFDVIQKNKFNSSEREIIRNLGVDLNQEFKLDDYQKLNAIFTNGRPIEYRDVISEDEFNNLKEKLLLTYEKFYEKNNYLASQADKEFHKKLIDNQIDLVDLQKEDLKENYEVNEDYLVKIKQIEREQRELNSRIRKAKAEGNFEVADKLRARLQGGLTENEKREFDSLIDKYQTNPNSLGQNEIQQLQELQNKERGAGSLEYERLSLMQRIGQVEYQKLERYDELIAQMNEQSKKLREQSREVKSIADESFNKNTSAIAHLGIKALRYQLDLKQKTHEQGERNKDFDGAIKKKEMELNAATSQDERNKINAELQKLKYDKRLWVGVKDYDDIDLIDKPLYLAPENMLPGYGSLTNLEEYKGVIRMSQVDFAKRILSDEAEYKRLREDYEKETGIKLTEENAIELAKRHIGGTFDNAHAGAWLKHFKREKDESEEHRIERFNKWLNTQAEEMVKEGVVKHIHFNDTQGKDDDHNLLGSGILDIHDMRERLRGAGVKEALIVEAGGRGADSSMHMMNAFDIFNPTLHTEERQARGYGVMNSNQSNSGVSDWVSVKREYENRPQYSHYGMNYNSFRGQAQPQQGRPSGAWSQTGFF